LEQAGKSAKLQITKQVQAHLQSAKEKASRKEQKEKTKRLKSSKSEEMKMSQPAHFKPSPEQEKGHFSSGQRGRGSFPNRSRGRENYLMLLNFVQSLTTSCNIMVFP
jgi:hypothetical protein